MAEKERGSPVVTWHPIRCPDCGSSDVRCVRKLKGELVSYQRCRECERSFKALERQAALKKD